MLEDPKESFWPLEFVALVSESLPKPDLYEMRLESVLKLISAKKVDRATKLEEIARLIIMGMRYHSPIDTKIVKVYHADWGIWVSSAQAMIEAHARYLWPKISSHGVNEIVKKIQTYKLGSGDIFDKQPVIACASGAFDLIRYKPVSFKPEHYITRRIPVNYDPDADCPAIKAFLRAVTDQENIRILEEAIGYCLWGEYCYQRAFLLFGPTQTGKSTFLKLLTTFLGPENVTGLTLQQLSKRQFGIAKMENTFANISAELPPRTIQNTDILKALTSGDMVDADRKYLDAVNYYNTSKLFFSANMIPPTQYDESDAYYGRWLIIDFPHQFLTKADPKLLSKLTTPGELSGLLNLAIAGLKRLHKRGRFEEVIDLAAKKRAYYLGSDTVKAFVLEKCAVKANAWIPMLELHSNYTTFCQELSRNYVAFNQFTRQLRKWVPELSMGKIRERGGRTRIYKGIGLLGGQLTQQQL